MKEHTLSLKITTDDDGLDVDDVFDMIDRVPYVSMVAVRDQVRSMTDLEALLLEFLPGSSIREDNEGQVIIYTNLKVVGDPDTDLISMEE